MLILKDTDSIQLEVVAIIKGVAVQASYVDLDGDTVTPGNTLTTITTGAVQTIIPAPATGVIRNVKSLMIKVTSDSSHRLPVTVLSGGVSRILSNFTVQGQESVCLTENGEWQRYETNGALYTNPQDNFSYRASMDFFKATTAPEAAGYRYCSIKDVGFPGPMNIAAPGVNGRMVYGYDEASGGLALPYGAGLTSVARAVLLSTVPAYHEFFDVLWINSGLSVTAVNTQQAIEMPGSAGYTRGQPYGSKIGLLFTAASTLAAVNGLATVTYTNMEGVSGRKATLSTVGYTGIPATPVIGTLVWFSLQAGDTGVDTIQSFNIGATSFLTGAISLLIAKPLFSLGTLVANVPNAVEYAYPGIEVDGLACICHALLATAATASTVSGQIEFGYR